MNGYGLSPDDPIRVSGFYEESRYLECLRRVGSDAPIKYERQGSCRAEETEHILDMYRISARRPYLKPVLLYIDIYGARDWRPPEGYTLSGPAPEEDEGGKDQQTAERLLDAIKSLAGADCAPRDMQQTDNNKPTGGILMDQNSNPEAYSGCAFVFQTPRNGAMAEKLLRLLEDAGMQAVCLDTGLMQERTMKLYMERHGEGPHILLFPYDRDNVKPFDIVSAAAMAAITFHPLIPAELSDDMAGEQALERMVTVAARYLAAGR